MESTVERILEYLLDLGQISRSSGFFEKSKKQIGIAAATIAAVLLIVFTVNAAQASNYDDKTAMRVSPVLTSTAHTKL